MATPGDKAVLNAIFNPLFPEDENDNEDDDENNKNISDNQSASTENSGQKHQRVVVAEQSSEENRVAGQLEIEGISFAERGELEQALKIFDDAIVRYPTRASLYNNRAQTLRLKGDLERAKRDLSTAIKLTEGKGKVARQAYNQRAVIARLESRESDAKTDFESAAKLGSEFAKSQLIMLNPYAALCGNMLKQMMDQCQKPP